MVHDCRESLPAFALKRKNVGSGRMRLWMPLSVDDSHFPRARGASEFMTRRRLKCLHENYPFSCPCLMYGDGHGKSNVVSLLPSNGRHGRALPFCRSGALLQHRPARVYRADGTLESHCDAARLLTLTKHLKEHRVLFRCPRSEKWGTAGQAFACHRGAAAT